MKRISILLGTLALTLGGANAASLFLDDFSTGFTPHILSVHFGNPTATSAETISNGASRDSLLEIGSLQGLIVSGQVDPGGITVSAGPGTNGQLKVVYDFRPISALGLDLSPFEVFRVQVLASDTLITPASADLSLTSADGNTKTANIDLNSLGLNDVPLTAWDGVDFSQVTDMQLDWEIGNANDVTLGFLGVATVTNPTTPSVPEPKATLPLMLLGVCASVSALRRRAN